MDPSEFGNIEFGQNHVITIEHVGYMRRILGEEKLSDTLYKKKNLNVLKLIFLGIEILALKYGISEEVGWFLFYNSSSGFASSYILYCKRTNKYTLNAFMSFIVKQVAACH